MESDLAECPRRNRLPISVLIASRIVSPSPRFNNALTAKYVKMIPGIPTAMPTKSPIPNASRFDATPGLTPDKAVGLAVGVTIVNLRC